MTCAVRLRCLPEKSRRRHGTSARDFKLRRFQLRRRRAPPPGPDESDHPGLS